MFEKLRNHIHGECNLQASTKMEPPPIMLYKNIEINLF